MPKRLGSTVHKRDQNLARCTAIDTCDAISCTARLLCTRVPQARHAMGHREDTVRPTLLLKLVTHVTTQDSSPTPAPRETV